MTNETLPKMPENFSVERVVYRLNGTEYGILLYYFEGKLDYVEVFQGPLQNRALLELFNSVDDALVWMGQRGLTPSPE